MGGHGFIEGFLKSWGVILASEIGDKTFFIAAIMAMRHARLTVRPAGGGGSGAGGPPDSCLLQAAHFAGRWHNCIGCFVDFCATAMCRCLRARWPPWQP